MPSSTRCLCVALVGLALLAAGAARLEAQGVPSGLRVSVTNVASLDASFDVTLYTTYPFVATPTGYLGDKFVTPTFGYVGTMLNPSVDAIYYGDGNVVDNTDVPLVTPGLPNVFRGSFTHTYPAAGNYPLKVGVASLLGYDSTVTLTTGNKVAANTLGFSVYSPFLSSTIYLLGTASYPVVVAITNTPGTHTPQGGAANGGSGVQVFAPPIPVPSLAESGLLLLTILMAGAGLVLLRR